MWVTRSTSLITPICIEIERPGKHWFNLDGTPTATLTQALDQLTDWKVWFSEPENQLIFRRTYMLDGFTDRPIQPQYVLIYGRRDEFDTTRRHSNPAPDAEEARLHAARRRVLHDVRLSEARRAVCRRADAQADRRWTHGACGAAYLHD